MTVSANELYAPLGASAPARPRFSLGLGVAGGAIIAGAALGLLTLSAIWLADPQAGDPRARAALPRVAPQVAEAPRRVETPEPAPEAVPVPEPRPTVSIITPGGPGQGMQVRTVEVADPATPTLRPAPDSRLVERHRLGLLPRVGADGTRPWRAYARPVPAGRPRGPRVAIIVGGMGLSTASTQEAIARLPGEVTLAFAPYAGNLQRQVDRARADGHEVLLQVPMEPFDYPANDPGPQTLLASLDAEVNRERLHWAMTRFAGYVGITNFMGGRFTGEPNAIRPVLQELRQRGLVFVDDGSAPRSQAPRLARELGVGHARGHVLIDAQPLPDRIDEALAQLEEEARRSGSAIGVASAFPLTLERLARWTRDLERRGVTLVPVSALTSGERVEPRASN